MMEERKDQVEKERMVLLGCEDGAVRLKIGLAATSNTLVLGCKDGGVKAIV